MGTTPQHANQQKNQAVPWNRGLNQFLAENPTHPIPNPHPKLQSFLLQAFAGLDVQIDKALRDRKRHEALLAAANRGMRRWRGLATRTIAGDHERKTVTVQQEGA